MKVTKTEIEDVLIIEPKVFGDNRGFFLEIYHKNRYFESGINEEFIQENCSFSVKNTLRGLHFQTENTQAKLLQVLQGEVYDVAVDIRYGSPTFGKWTGVYLSGDNKRQLFIPEGFAHGFCVTSENALFQYKCSDFYNPEKEEGVLWCDSDLNIDWPLNDPILSEKDIKYSCLKDIPVGNLPQYKVK